MKAVKISAVGQAALEEKERPAAQPGEVLLKVIFAGFCGSDLNTYLGMNPMVRMPVIPGHEISAVVEQVTEGVPANIRWGCTVR